VISALADALSSPSTRVQEDSIMALRAFGPAAQPAVARLRDLQKANPVPWMQQLTSSALAAIESPAGAPKQ
jgi:hypothetical protein